MDEKNRHLMAKGTFYIMMGQIVFMGSGYVIHMGLARLVDADEYGRFGVILSLLLLSQVFLGKGVPEAISKYIAEGRDTEDVLKKGAKVQMLFSIVVFTVLVSLSSFIANLLNDDRLTWYIVAVAFLIPVRSANTIFRGTYIGLRQFKKVYMMRFINALIRIPLVFIFVFMGFSIMGAIYGYILAAFCGLLILFSWFEGHRPGAPVSYGELIDFSYPLIIFSVAYLFIINIDLLFVKGMLASDQAGFYTSARIIGGIPYLAANALSFTLLPSIAKSHAEGNHAQTRSYVSESFRYTVMILLPLTVLISVMASGILDLLYPSEYGEASTALTMFVIGNSLLVFFIIAGSMLMGVGKQKILMCLALFLMALASILNYSLVRERGIEGAAMATTTTCFIATCLILVIVKRTFGTIMSGKSFARIMVAVLPIALLGYLIPVSGPLIVPWAFVLLLIYLGTLHFMKEINAYDLSIVKSFISKG